MRGCSLPGFPQLGPHPLKGGRYGESGCLDGVDQAHLLYSPGGAGVEQVLGVSQLMVSTRQVRVQPLYGLSILELCHYYPPNSLRQKPLDRSASSSA